MSRNPGMHHIGESGFQNILAGPFPNITEDIVLKSGQAYPAGSVLGRETATGVCSLVDSGKSDGTESVYAVLLDAVDATARDMSAIGFLTGEFNAPRLVFGGTDTAETHKAAARLKDIFFKEAVQ